MKAIISTGQGRLHLVESAKSILEQGIDVKLITGWVPYWSDKWLNMLGRLIGRNNLAYGFSRRREFGKERTQTCSFSEFYIQFLFVLSHLGLLKKEVASVAGWKKFGKQSKQYLNDAQIFHVRSGAGQGGAIDFARKRGMKIIVDHSIAHPQEMYNQLLKSFEKTNEIIKFDKGLLNSFWQNIVLQDCKDADVLLVNSKYVKDSFIENGFNPDKLIVVELGVRKEFHAIKKDWSISNPIRLLFTGGFSRRKGALLIIDCIQQLITEQIPVRIDIIGTISKDITIPEWFAASHDVLMHGYLPQDEMMQYFAKTDMYIFPSYTEGSAQSLNEAMLAGLPVIATIQSGAPIVHKENGYIIPDDSSEALKEAIIELATNHELRKSMGKKAVETMTENFTWEKYASKVIEVYKKMLV